MSVYDPVSLITPVVIVTPWPFADLAFPATIPLAGVSLSAERLLSVTKLSFEYPVPFSSTTIDSIEPGACSIVICAFSPRIVPVPPPAAVASCCNSAILSCLIVALVGSVEYPYPKFPW